MTEYYLHALWRRKLIPFHNLTLTDGRSLEIIHFGFYNRNTEGPDFAMGIVAIDGVEEVGAIELHIKSSDWYRHKHHLDVNYNDVRLHVVYEHDRDVVQNGRTLPTLALKELIEPAHKRRMSKNPAFVTINEACSFLPDAVQIPDQDPLIHALEGLKESMLVQQLEVKSNEFMVHGYSLPQLGYLLLARACSSPVNKASFEMITKRVPISILLDLSVNQTFELILERSDYFISEQKAISWYRTGFLPKGSPAIRIRQFSWMLAMFKDRIIEFLSLDFDEFKAEIRRTESDAVFKVDRFSDELIRSMYINGSIRFQFYKLYLQQVSDQYPDVLKQLKKIHPEKNRITRAWEKKGLRIQSAFDSQGLLSLSSQGCLQKKCLNCAVSRNLLTGVLNPENTILL